MMKLKPCPFCGQQPTYGRLSLGIYQVGCSNPDCNVRVIAESKMDLPIEAWNTRAEEPAEEKTAHWDINCDGYYPFCSNCKENAVKMSKYCPNCGAKMITRERKQMHIIKHECGYINADMIEFYGIREGLNDWQICAYTSYDEGKYILGRCMIKENAEKRLYYLVEWLTSGKDGIFDAMHIWESDDDKDDDNDD